MKHFALHVSLFLAFICFVPIVAATPIVTFNFTATGYGGVIVGTFGYDTAVADTYPSVNVSLFNDSGFIAGSVTGGPQGGAVFNLKNLDWGLTLAINSHRIQVYNSNTFINLTDSTGTAFSDDSLPGDLDSADFDFRGFYLSAVDIGGVPGQYHYEIASISRPVPEPATMLLLGSGFIGLVGIRRKFKKS
jgi:hypothetical protein